MASIDSDKVNKSLKPSVRMSGSLVMMRDMTVCEGKVQHDGGNVILWKPGEW